MKNRNTLQTFLKIAKCIKSPKVSKILSKSSFGKWHFWKSGLQMSPKFSIWHFQNKFRKVAFLNKSLSMFLFVKIEIVWTYLSNIWISFETSGIIKSISLRDFDHGPSLLLSYNLNEVCHCHYRVGPILPLRYDVCLRAFIFAYMVNWLLTCTNL